jgi:hypothetical protein
MFRSAQTVQMGRRVYPQEVSDSGRYLVTELPLLRNVQAGLFGPAELLFQVAQPHESFPTLFATLRCKRTERFGRDWTASTGHLPFPPLVDVPPALRGMRDFNHRDASGILVR